MTASLDLQFLGSRLEFECVVEGNPFPKVIWRKGQWLQIDDGGRYDVRRNPETGLCTMAIKVRGQFCDQKDEGTSITYSHKAEVPTSAQINIVFMRCRRRERPIWENTKLWPQMISVRLPFHSTSKLKRKAARRQKM